jgi:hypothetical protein
MTTDVHDQIIRAFQEYFKWQDRFEYKGSEESAIKARNALSNIRNLANDRRAEIQAKRIERKKARKEAKEKAEPITK